MCHHRGNTEACPPETGRHRAAGPAAGRTPDWADRHIRPLPRKLSRSPHLLDDETHTAFFAAEQRRAVFGMTPYALSALVAAWAPVAGLVIACTLPLFYGMTSTGWRSPGSRPPSAPLGAP